MYRSYSKRKRPLIAVLGLILILSTIILAVQFLPSSLGSRTSAYAGGNYTVSLPVVVRDHPLGATIFGIEGKELTAPEGINEIIFSRSTWVRRNGLFWSSVEPKEGTRYWSHPTVKGLEVELKNASMNGMEVILIIRKSPDWAQQLPGTPCGPIKANKLGAFANFMRDVVARYSKPPYNVKYYELWNEPDIAPAEVDSDSIYGCWGDPNDQYFGGGYYAQMLQAVYPQIKGANPDAQVLVGGLLLFCNPDNPPSGMNCTPSKFLQGILEEGGGPYFDGVSFHAYDFYGNGLGRYANLNWNAVYNTTGPVSNVKAQFVRNVLSSYGFGDKFLINTESGLLCDSCNNDATFELTKAYYVAQVYPAAIDDGMRANMWFRILGWRNSNLLELNLNPLPAYHAFVFSRQILADAKSLGPISGSDISGSGVAGYKLDRSGTQVWVIWSLDGSPHTISFGLGAPDGVYDVFGNTFTPAATMTIDIAPRYLEWKP